MDVVSTIVGKMLEPMIDHLFKSTWRQIGYVVHYKENIKNFEDEVEKLRHCMERVQEDVNMALDNGMVVEEDVKKWLEKVQSEEVTKLLQDKENLCCLDVCSRHQLGREAKKKMMVVTGLQDEGYKFLRVAHPSRLTDIWYSSSTNFEQFESRKSVFKEIMEALKDGSNYKIGIYGMPGVGKTTMGEEVGKQAGKGLFDEVAMAVFSQNPDLKKIQGKLADCLNLKLDKETEEGRAGELCNRLMNGRKILVILDDVWGDQLTLKKIGIPHHVDNSKGCKILLTSRRLEVCKQMGFEKNFEIGLLSKPEAWQLFKRTVGDYIEDDPEMFSVAGKVCRECDCLPLAILAVGAALKDEKEKHVWDDALEQLRNFQGDKIEGLTEKLYSHVEWSYNYLKQTDLQLCFLHCCLFIEDEEISVDDDLVRYGVGTGFLRGSDTMKKARDRAHTLVNTLKKSYLLLEGRNENFVKMHDIIRDVAISIASKDPNVFMVKDDVKVWPENDDYKCCTTISLSASPSVRRLPNQLDCRGLRTLILRSSSPYCSLELPNSFFEGMEQLQVLNLYQIQLLPSSLSNLVNLRMLHLCSCELVDLSFLEKLKNLEILRVVDYLRDEWMVLEIGQLTHLRVLDLRDCNENAITFPSSVLSCLSNLEELYLPYKFDKWDCKGNARIVELNSLTSLTTLHISIPDSSILLSKGNLPSFKLLTRYRIFIGNISGNFLYSMQFKYSERKILGLAGIPLNVELNFLIENAEVLHFYKMEGLKKVEGEFFLDLKNLKVKKCDDMEHLLGKPHGPYPLGSFGKLSVLEVTECRLIKYLFSPSIARGLPKLQKLNIENCDMLEEIVGGDEEAMDNVIFHQLKEMRLEFLPNLRSISSNTKKTSTTECNPSTIKQALFNDKVTCPVLEKLYIRELNSITAIWDKQLLPVKEGEDTFKHLQDIYVEGCEKMEEIVAFEIGQGEEARANVEIAVFAQLKSMELTKLPSLKSFCISYGSEKEETSGEGIPQIQALFNHKVTCPVLEKLYIRELNSITAIWDKQLLPVKEGEDTFKHLQDIYVEGCEKMEEIVAFEIGQGEEARANVEIVVFAQLKSMELTKLPSLKSFCISYGSEKEETSGEGIPQIQALFNHKVTCPLLEKLYIEKLDRITAIWDKQLLPVQEAEDTFEHLQELDVKDCEKMEEIVAFRIRQGEEAEAETNDDIAVFTQLKSMELKWLPSLKSFCISYGSEKEETSGEGIPQIQALFNHKVAFRMLEELKLCDGLIEDIRHGHIPSSSLSKVRVLTVSYCSKLVNVLPTLLQRFEAVEQVHLSYCSSLEVVVDVFNLEGLNAIERQGFLVFCNNLTVLHFATCNSLRYLFSVSIATALTQLERLSISFCSIIEEIVRNEEQGPEEDAASARDNIITLFPRLEYLHLWYLPNLRSFYGPNNIAFQLPSLDEIWINQCAEIWTTRKPAVTSFFGNHIHASLEQQIDSCLQKKDDFLCWKHPEQSEIPEQSECTQPEVYK